MTERRNILLRIRRQEQENKSPYWQEYRLAATEKSRILDLLEKVREKFDESLAFRANCGQGSCGSDAMQINGQNRLACQTLLEDLGNPEEIVIRPLPGFKVLKDLVVDMSELQAKNKKIPSFLAKKNSSENPQAPKQQEKIIAAASCIRCGCCQSACPAAWQFNDFSGPAPLTLVYRYLFDSRDILTEERIRLLQEMDIWKCFTIYNCIEVCPREINVTGLISELKRAHIEGKVKT
ncbi:MAG: succinate dehydrogenase/fumarate reductase iron-sulfur subunit [bacterium]